MPQVSAAVRRSAPSSTIARASIRRAAEPSFSRPAAARRSFAVKSGLMILTAPPIDAAPPSGASIESEFPRFGNPKMSQKPRPLVSIVGDAVSSIERLGGSATYLGELHLLTINQR